MHRVTTQPRENWLAKVEAEGLTYAVDRAEDGTALPYWDESAYYVLSEAEVDELERVTDELHGMAVEAAERMVEDESVVERLGLPPGSGELLRRSLHDDGEVPSTDASTSRGTARARPSSWSTTPTPRRGSSRRPCASGRGSRRPTPTATSGT